MTKHLYIHIPFCKNICTYCDFCRIKINQDDSCIQKYVDMVIEHVINQSIYNQYETIYLGGGTPNFLNDELLNRLLLNLKKYIDISKPYEFCLECNPEFVTPSQVKILKENGINRVSLGVQTINNKILKKIERTHTIDNVKNAINILHNHQLNNISCDFIYALDGLSQDDLKASIEFIKQNKIMHVSFYALEIKHGSILAKQKFIVNEQIEADQLEYIDDQLKLNGFERYEVSNWCIDQKYQSLHNKSYWLSNDWKAIGFGSIGFECHQMYKWSGSILAWKNEIMELDPDELEYQILMMGLRLVDGIDVINNSRNAQAYQKYKHRIIDCEIKNDHLVAKNINLLSDVLINMMDENN